MTISFNGGVDPEEIKFNGQDMEAVVLYNDQFPNGVTVWEKVVGVEYTVTSGGNNVASGWYAGFYGSISPQPSDGFYIIITDIPNNEVQIYFQSVTTVFPDKIKFNGIIYNINPFVNDPFFGKRSSSPAANLQPFYNSLAVIGNNTTFELIYP